MKNFLVSLCLLPVIAFSQDTTTIEQYCEITIFPKPRNKVTLYINYGSQPRNATRDTTLKNPPEERAIFDNKIDVLNYMGRHGWQVVHVIRMPADAVSEMYLLRKRFARGVINN